MKVRVYYNLHKSCWSIKAHEGILKGRVIAHADGVKLRDARTVVSQAGRERVIREGKKNVHAFIEGNLVAVESPKWRYRFYEDNCACYMVMFAPDVRKFFGGEIRYNPYKVGHFYWAEDDQSTEHQILDEVVMTRTRKVWATGEHLYD